MFFSQFQKEEIRSICVILVSTSDLCSTMGCSQTRTETMKIEPLKVDSTPNLKKKKGTSFQNATRIIEDSVGLWLLDDPSVNVDEELSKLRKIISTIQLFTAENDLIDYLKTIQFEKAFVIVPKLDVQFDSLRSLPQLERIYQLNSGFRLVENHDKSKVSTEMFENIDSLCKQLEEDVRLCGLDLIPITTTPAHSDDKSVDYQQQQATFLMSQLMKEIFYRLKFENNAKAEFIEFCRSQYAGNKEQIREIEDFETNYRPQKAIVWLTKQSFIWRILQRMQRTMEIDILYKMGFFLKHGHTQLNIAQENNVDERNNSVIVYRGKTMFKQKFNKLIRYNKNGLLCFANFFVANLDQTLSMEFVRRRLAFLSEAVGIIFEIHVDQSLQNSRSPFAPLHKLIPDESKDQSNFFFAMNTVFRIENVDQFIDELMNIIWTVKLTLIGDEDPQLLELVAPLRSSEVHANPLAFIGKLFMEMGEYSRAEQFFLGMLNDSSILGQPKRLVRVHIGLGTNYINSNQYDKALQQYHEALRVSLTYLSSTHKDLAPIYDSIGRTYFLQGNHVKAGEFYGKAADLIGGNQSTDGDSQPNDLNVANDKTRMSIKQNK